MELALSILAVFLALPSLFIAIYCLVCIKAAEYSRETRAREFYQGTETIIEPEVQPGRREINGMAGPYDDFEPEDLEELGA